MVQQMLSADFPVVQNVSFDAIKNDSSKTFKYN